MPGVKGEGLRGQMGLVVVLYTRRSRSSKVTGTVLTGTRWCWEDFVFPLYRQYSRMPSRMRIASPKSATAAIIPVNSQRKILY